MGPITSAKEHLLHCLLRIVALTLLVLEMILNLPLRHASIGGLIIRIWFGAQYTIAILRNPQNSIGNYLGPYSSLLF